MDDDPDFLELLITEIGSISARCRDRRGRRTGAGLAGIPYPSRLQARGQRLGLGKNQPVLEVLTQADGLIPQQEDAADFSYKTPVLFISGSDKVGQTQVLQALRHFEPVSFIRKSCGLPLIGMLAERILAPLPDSTRDLSRLAATFEMPRSGAIMHAA